MRLPVIHRLAVPLREKPVRFDPLVAEPFGVGALLVAVPPENVHHRLREFERPLRLLRFSRVGVCTPCGKESRFCSCSPALGDNDCLGRLKEF